MMNVEDARRYLNGHAALGQPRSVKQRDDAPLGLGGWHFRVFPFDSLNIHFAECRIENRGRFVGCPNPPQAYVISNRGKATRYRPEHYGRALRHLATLVARASGESA